MELFYDILKQLIRVPSVVGAEHPFFMFLKRELEELGLTLEYYDGLLVAKGKNPTDGYICAHADRHGLICTGRNEFQYAAFIAKNQADLQKMSNTAKLLKNFTNRFVEQKVQAYQPFSGSYLGLGVIEDAFLCERRNNIFFKIEGFDYLLPSTPIAFMDKLMISQEGLVSAQLDNVLSVALIVYLYHLGYQGTAFFSASEEAGRSWRFLLEWFLRSNATTDELLVLDTSPYERLEDIANLELVFRNRDQNGYFRSPLKAKIKKLAIQKGIKYHYKDAYLKNKMAQQELQKGSIGVTELGQLIHASKGSIQGTTLQIPTIGYHTANETTYTKSIDAIVDILHALYLDSPS